MLSIPLRVFVLFVSLLVAGVRVIAQDRSRPRSGPDEQVKVRSYRETAISPDGRRVAFHVASVDGMHEGKPVVTEVFSFRTRAGRGGRFEATGAVPKVVSMLRARGELAPDRLFQAGFEASS